MRQLFRRLMNHQYLTQDQINGFDNYKVGQRIDTHKGASWAAVPSFNRG